MLLDGRRRAPRAEQIGADELKELVERRTLRRRMMSCSCASSSADQRGVAPILVPVLRPRFLGPPW